MSSLLSLENIRKEYEGKVAVDGLSLEVPKGVIYGIIGPNGAGKTTSIRMIMNITAPDSGRILFNGKEPDDSFKDHVGYLPEERGLYKKLTVREVVAYLAELKGMRAKQVAPLIEPWLKRIDLIEYADKKVEELSKGMQQKLQFVTTIIHEPEIEILYELFSGLDPLNIELIKNILLEMKQKGRTVLFSTHVMEQAEKLCDFVCMISRGKKVVDGRMNEVKSRFGRNAVQVDLEGDIGLVRQIPGVSGVSEFNNYVELQLKDGVDPNDILKALVGKVSIRRFEVVVPSLYSIFIDLAKTDPAESQRGEVSGVE